MRLLIFASAILLMCGCMSAPKEGAPIVASSTLTSTTLAPASSTTASSTTTTSSTSTTTSTLSKTTTTSSTTSTTTTIQPSIPLDVNFSCGSLKWVSQQQECKRCEHCDDKAKHGECYNNSQRLFDEAGLGRDYSFDGLLQEDRASIKSLCYTALAVLYSDPSMCFEIYYAPWRSYCFTKALFGKTRLANNITDYGYCDQITDQDLRNTCLKAVANATHDTSGCERMNFSIDQWRVDITGPQQKADCVCTVARGLYTTDNQLAQQIIQEKIDEKYRDTCYGELAREQKKTTLCNLINDTTLQQDCETRIKENRH